MATTGLTLKEQTAFLRDSLNGKPLTPEEREALLKSHLPPTPSSSSPTPSRTNSKRAKTRKVRLHKPKTGRIRNFVHFVIYQTIALIFSVFFRFRRAWRLFWYKVCGVMGHHHRSPEWIVNDVKNLEQLPRHLSVVLDYNEDDEDQGTAGLEGLLNDVCEIAAWSASAGIPLVSIYERTGALKNYPKQTYEAISRTLETYFGPHRCPSLTIKSPHMPSYSRPTTPTSETTEDGTMTSRPHLTVLFLSELDGRNTLIDLTVTLSHMAQKGDVRVDQINANLIDAELNDHVSTEPDLLILFSPTVVLKGYPPWQLRLTEIFHLPDNKGVNYQVFLQALKKFGKAEFRVGK
ncbi:di-trans,poly-cis-decaprenylcistransferas-like protein [Lentithecium fluviatile CBS 122367]|uniref:ditrans,polycis-polyprenyl diphosphate synthase [(2E,6E)-farnesyldiphosphate specific] n=1 Tax=Lentithecium fluviatile CBS 122367 TaxID=1168545 RepID=A0A6G1IXB5_9PLEO|nr:di-trans,poly-cis-decaprenylcistransferas-like protein [Lentithecium fluviatile CBS 122367]